MTADVNPVPSPGDDNSPGDSRGRRKKSQSTHTKRLAKRLAEVTDLTYQQAFGQVQGLSAEAEVGGGLTPERIEEIVDSLVRDGLPPNKQPFGGDDDWDDIDDDIEDAYALAEQAWPFEGLGEAAPAHPDDAGWLWLTVEGYNHLTSMGGRVSVAHAMDVAERGLVRVHFLLGQGRDLLRWVRFYVAGRPATYEEDLAFRALLADQALRVQVTDGWNSESVYPVRPVWQTYNSLTIDGPRPYDIAADVEDEALVAASTPPPLIPPPSLDALRSIPWDPAMAHIADHINLDLPHARHIVVTGPTGSGKTQFAMSLLDHTLLHTGDYHVVVVDLIGTWPRFEGKQTPYFWSIIRTPHDAEAALGEALTHAADPTRKTQTLVVLDEAAHLRDADHPRLLDLVRDLLSRDPEATGTQVVAMSQHELSWLPSPQHPNPFRLRVATGPRPHGRLTLTSAGRSVTVQGRLVDLLTYNDDD